MGQEERGKQRRGGETTIPEAMAGVLKAQGACLTVGKPDLKALVKDGACRTSTGRQSWLVPTGLSSQQEGRGRSYGRLLCFIGSCQREPLGGVFSSLDSHVSTTISGAISESNTTNVAILIPAAGRSSKFWATVQGKGPDLSWAKEAHPALKQELSVSLGLLVTIFTTSGERLLSPQAATERDQVFTSLCESLDPDK